MPDFTLFDQSDYDFFDKYRNMSDEEFLKLFPEAAPERAGDAGVKPAPSLTPPVVQGRPVPPPSADYTPGASGYAPPPPSQGLLPDLRGRGGSSAPMSGSGGSAWGPMLMALGGGIAGGANEGWGAGIGQGLTSAAAIRQRQDALNREDALQRAHDAQQTKLTQMKIDAAANAPPKLTTLQKNLQAGGLTEGTPEYNKAMLDAITHPNSTVNIGPGETAWETGINKNMAEQYTTMQTGAAASQTKLNTISALEDALGKASYTGYGAKEILAAKKAAKLVGIDVGGDVSGEEAAVAIGNQLALQLRNPAGGAGMPGSLSNSDRDYLEQATIGLEKTPQGNKRLIDISRRTEKRNIDVYRKANKYIKDHGKLEPNFFDELADWSEKNPLFSEDEKKKAAGAAAAGGGGGGGDTAIKDYNEYFKGP